MKSKIMFMAACLTLAGCGASAPNQSADQSLIGKSNMTIEGGKMTPEALWAMGRMGGVAVSPDAEQIAYSVSYYSVEQNKSNSELFIMDKEGGNIKQLTSTPFYEGSATWIKEGSKIAFISTETGTPQVWEMNPDGSGKRQLSDAERGVEDFSFSPDGKKVVLISPVKVVESTQDKHPDLDKTTGKVIDDLMYKHWDEWKVDAPHPFIGEFDGDKITNLTDIMAGEPYESPMRPFGGIEQISWNTTSDVIAYTSRKKVGLEYAISTDSDIYLYNINTGETTNMTPENMGYDTNPQYAPTGDKIAWLSMERDGYEADQNRLFIMDIATGEREFISKEFESNVDDFTWSKDGKTIYFTGVWHATSQLYSLNVESKELTKLTEGKHDFISVSLFGDQLLAKRQSMSAAPEIFAVTLDGEQRQLSFENKHIFDQLDLANIEQRWITTTDGKEMLTWVVYPPNFDPNKQYPTLLYCQGGPQSPVSQFWSFRWNLQIMAANDYIIVAPNRRGLPGFGLEWNEAISGDYGGQVMKDYLTAIDEVAKEPFVNSDRLGCVGASFGGYSAFWLAGNHDKRFKAFIAHDGIFNTEMQYLETEELFFANWDMGGPYWDKENKVAQKTYATSPHLYVDKWDTPILCIHGEKDYRILANQTMAAFNAAKLKGVPAQLLIYPDENHWVLKPQNGILWQRTFFNWLDKWLK